MIRTGILVLVCFAALAVVGCGGPRVAVPPRIDLAEHSTVGLVEFTSNSEGKLAEYATQRFLELASESQAGARFLELGKQDELLKSIGKDKMDVAAVQALGKKHNIATIIVGDIDVSSVKPKIRIGIGFSPMAVEAEVEATMMAKMLATVDGATLWTDSARDKKRVAHVSVFSSDVFVFDAEDPDEAYGDLIESLVRDVSVDFRTTYR
jgi:hypothetical protein